MVFLLREWDSKSELLANAEHWTILGTNAEAPRKFYSFEYDLAEEKSPSIGIISSGLGIKPVLKSFQDGTILVLYDKTVSILKGESLKLVRSWSLEGVGLELVNEGTGKLIVVLHELGLCAFDSQAERKWSLTSNDTLEDWKIGSQNDITIVCSDGSRQTIELANGSLVSKVPPLGRE